MHLTNIADLVSAILRYEGYATVLLRDEESGSLTLTAHTPGPIPSWIADDLAWSSNGPMQAWHDQAEYKGESVEDLLEENLQEEIIGGLDFPINWGGYTMNSIVTHPGVFHSDEVMATAMILVEIGDIPISRRRATPADLAGPDTFVLDQGGQFAPGLNNYDHHQADPALGSKSTAGLVLEYVVRPVVGAEVARYLRPMMSFIDDWDEGRWPVQPGAVYLPQAISAMNNGKITDEAAQMERFMFAVSFCRQLYRAWRDRARDMARNRPIWDAAPYIQTRLPGGGVKVLDVYIPWKGYVDYGTSTLQAVLAPTGRTPEEGAWGLTAVPRSHEEDRQLAVSVNRLLGMRNQAEIPGCTFIHKGQGDGDSSFFAAFTTRQAAIEAISNL